MVFQVNCPHCKKVLNVTEKAFGRTLPCPGCSKPVTVPQQPTIRSPQAASTFQAAPRRDLPSDSRGSEVPQQPINPQRAPVAVPLPPAAAPTALGSLSVLAVITAIALVSSFLGTLTPGSLAAARGALERDSAAVNTPPPTSPAAPPAPVAPPKMDSDNPSPREMAFAAKLVVFLDSCDDLVKLLEKGAKTEQYSKQCEIIRSRQAAIPAVPQGVRWAEKAVELSEETLVAVSVLNYSAATQDALAEALKQPSTDSPEIRAAYRQVASEIRKPVAAIRGLIPPACLAKPK